ncbi:MAG: hypothetical protein QXF88_00150 [Candidatus Aenigmatarchaeota archaeon]
MDDLDILSSALLELKKKIDDQNKTIEKLNLEKLDLIEKYNFLLQKINDVSLKQKENEKYGIQLNKDLEKYRQILDDVESLVDKKFEDIIKRIDAEKIKEKIKDLEALKDTDKKISDILNFQKQLEKRIYENQKIISDFRKEIDSMVKQEDKKQQNYISEKTGEYFDKISQNLNEIRKEIKDQKTQISEIIKDNERLKQLNASRFEALLKADSNFNQIMKKYEDYIIDLEKKINEKIKILEKTSKSSDDELSRALTDDSKEIEEIKSYLQKLKNSIDDIENEIRQNKNLQNEHMEKMKNNLESTIKLQISELKKEILNDIWKEKKDIALNLDKIKILEKKYSDIEKDYERLNNELMLSEKRVLEDARRVSKKEIEKSTQDLVNENSIINQKLKQMEISFNLLAKNSNNFYDALKKDMNYIRDFTLSLDNSIKDEVEKRLILQERLEDLNLGFRRVIDENDSFKSNIEDRTKKLIDHINMLEKSISTNQKDLFSYVNNEQKKHLEYTEKNIRELNKKIEEFNKDKKSREDYRVEKLNNLLKELYEKKASIEVKIDVLSSYINKFNEMKNSFRKEIAADVNKVVRDIESKQKTHDSKIIIADKDIKDMEKRIDKMEKTILELSKQVEVWKERYKLQLGRIAQEVDFE